MGSLRSSSMNKEEQMTMFLEMRKRERMRNNLFILQNSNEFDAPPGSKTSHSHLPMNNNAHTTLPKNDTNEFLNSQNSRNDYDWLMTPPETPVFPSQEPESQTTLISLLRSTKNQPPEQKSRIVKPQEKHAAKTNLPAARKPASSNGLNTSITESHKSSSSVGLRAITPIRRPSLSTTSSRSSQPSDPKSTRTPTKPVSATTTKSRSTTIPSSKATIPPPRSSSPISKATVPPPRSSSPISKATVPPPRSSSPISKATVPQRSSSPISKTTSRSLTPSTTQTTPSSRPRTPTRGPVLTTTSTKNPAPIRSTSPIVKPRPLKPTDMPGFSSDVPPNLRTSLPERLKSANRGRPGVPTIRSSSVEPLPNGKVRRQSCSPDRGSAIRNYGSSVPALNRLHAKANDNVSPVMVGTKMVERLVNMRKLAPPKQEDKNSPAGKTSPESSGFGRTLSKKSLDMAMRHMDIKRSIPGNLQPLMSNIPASSMYSVRTGPGRSKTINMSESNKQ